MSCNKEIARALGHDCWVDYEIETISKGQTLAETIPPFLTLRNSNGRTYKEFKEICGDGTWADGTPIKVGVGDTGIDATHLSRGEFGDAVNRNFTSDRTATDINGHGSHVSGHIVARANNSQIQGIAAKSKLYSAKVLGGRQGSGLTSWIQNGIEWMAENGCKIINLSLGGGGFDRTSAALYKRLDEAGIIVNAATGNAGKGGERGGYPARYVYVNSIGAVDYRLATASFSSESRTITKVGYGVGIDSLWINGRRASISGTSMATPDQTGLDLNFLGYFDRLGKGKLSRLELDELLQVGIVDLGIDGRDTYYGAGFVDIWKVIDHYGLPEDKDPVDPVDPVDPPKDCPVPEKPEVLKEFDFDGKKYGVIAL
jgi:hypothetical protein